MGKKILDSKALYVILSIIISFSAWLFVTSKDGMKDSAPFRNIPVTFAGTEILEGRGLMIVNDDATASITMQAAPMVLANLSNDPPTLTADVSNITAEGSHTLSLTVKPWQLIGAKLLCAVVTTFLSVVVAILSVLVIVPWSLEDLQVLFKGFQYLFGHWDLEVTRAFLGLLELLLLMLVSFATGFLQLYLAMSVGHLFNKNRVAMSVVAFIAINAVMSTLLSTVVPGLDPIIRPLLNGQSGQSLYHRSMWLAIAGELVLSAIYFAGTEFILRKKLNLE